MRIAKYLAHCGVASRREAERHIAAGHVTVNGHTINTPALDVADADTVTFKGQPLALNNTQPKVWLYHKPRGVITSHKDPEGRQTVYEQLPQLAGKEHIISIGRLDMNTEGLLLLTNHKPLANYMEHPASKIARTYEVKCFGAFDADKLHDVQQGITLEGIHYAPCTIKVLRHYENNHWLQFTLTEGKNREIRHFVEYMGMKVNRLVRVRYGPFKLGKLTRNTAIEADENKVKQLVKDATNH